MPITITIHGDNAVHALDELTIFASRFMQSPMQSVFVPDTTHLQEKVERQVAAVEEMYEEALVEDEGNVSISSETSPSSSTAGIEVDSAGVVFDPDIHTGTKKKDGTWRLRKGVASQGESEAFNTILTTLAENAVQTDDEFAAFREAAEETAEPVAVPARTWTDADLGQLCNDAAVKLNNPAPIKALIAKYVPEGEVAHSRNIPNADREAFAQEIEAAAGIEYAG